MRKTCMNCAFFSFYHTIFSLFVHPPRPPLSRLCLPFLFASYLSAVPSLALRVRLVPFQLGLASLPPTHHRLPAAKRRLPYCIAQWAWMDSESL